MSPPLNPATHIPVPTEIESFLNEHHVLSLCTAALDGTPYAANCYYIFLNGARTGDSPDTAAPCFVFLSDRKTRHGRELLANSAVAGTVHVEPPATREGVTQIQGVQFTGRASLLSDAGAPKAAPLVPQFIEHARESYYAKFEYAREAPADFWLLSLEYLKMTDNSVRFGFKRYWPESPE